MRFLKEDVSQKISDNYNSEMEYVPPPLVTNFALTFLIDREWILSNFYFFIFNYSNLLS